MDSTQTNQRQQPQQPPYPDFPPLIESRATEYNGTGITSSVAIAGHPLHPLLVTFPVVFLTCAAASDIGYWITGDMFWARVSLWSIGLGLVSGIIAALTGMSDFLRIPRVRKRTAGWLHLILNVTALVLTGVNYWLRLGNMAAIIVPVGVILSVIVAAMLGVSGWYGGELAYRHKIAVIGPGETQLED
ncbi:MAG: DUF2231 domain-containing protein [Chloroflexaceae bacterium]|nr:DUF2231 domain-containing protein [Chloroflexaceae bacterium]